jgi:Insertion element 4 transposase N-terminal/Transposase DDE domain
VVGMDFGQALLQAAEGRAEASFALFAETLDPQWIERALRATGKASVRRRKFPAEYVVWLVIGMGLFRDRSIQEVVRHLDLVLPGSDRDHQTVSGGAIVQARDRLGPQPLAWLFEQTAEVWATACADEQRWRGLAVYGVDGTTLRVPDSAENDAEFGRPGTSRGGAAAGYPQLRLVALMVLRSHLLAALAVGPYRDGELTLAEELWTKLPDRSLTIVDREFATYEIFQRLANPGRERHWLTRAKRGKTAAKLRTVQRLGPNDAIVELRPSRQTRRVNPALPETLRVRAIRYHKRGFRPQILLTSLLDPKTYPAAEIIALYHERWELELGFDEVKTHTLEREEALLRCKAPERIRQELWGLALAYNLVRLAMARVARRADVSPTRISYRHALNFIRAFWLTAHFASPGVLPRRLEALHQELALLILPPRRPRRFPRTVKIKMSKFPRKRPRPRRGLK